MKWITRYYKKMRAVKFLFHLIVVMIASFFIPSYTEYESEGFNKYIVYLNDICVGSIADKDRAEDLLRSAKLEVGSRQDEITLMGDFELRTQGQEMITGRVDEETTVFDNMVRIVEDEVKVNKDLERVYTVKVNTVTVNLSSVQEVKELLQQEIRKYDAEQDFEVSLEFDAKRQLNVQIPVITNHRKEKETEQENSEQSSLYEAGVEQLIEKSVENAYNNPEREKGFEDFAYQLVDMHFSGAVEVVESYLLPDALTELNQAASDLFNEQETQQIYKVKSGDTLSEIALEVGIPMDDIVSMNASLEDKSSVLQINQELIITVPKPELSVIWTDEVYYEESYEAPIQYIYNDEWYTTKQVTLQEPSAGFHKVVAHVTYANEEESCRDIVKEDVIMEAVPKIVEKGTIVPPTYLKPISGGRMSSGFGKRKAPKAGASTYHKGVDWATPIGTAVYASSGGTVAKAGWGSGYGYVIYINHPDGNQTRYGHLSKINVSVGQAVSQGEKIASSGNSGRSTGPHLHFEILIGGTQVNPLNYLD